MVKWQQLTPLKATESNGQLRAIGIDAFTTENCVNQSNEKNIEPYPINLCRECRAFQRCDCVYGVADIEQSFET